MTTEKWYNTKKLKGDLEKYYTLAYKEIHKFKEENGNGKRN